MRANTSASRFEELRKKFMPIKADNLDHQQLPVSHVQHSAPVEMGKYNLKNIQDNRTQIMSSRSSEYQTNSQRSHTVNKTQSMKMHLNDFKNNISEMENIFRKSSERLDNSDLDSPSDPVVTYPDDTPVPSEISTPTSSLDHIKYEQKRSNNIRTTKIVTDSYSEQKASSKYAESKSLQTGEVSYEENAERAACHAKLEMDGVSAEKSRLKSKEARSLITSDATQQQMKNMAHSSVKIKTGTFSAENTSTQAQKERQIMTSNGRYNAVHTSSSQSNITYTSSSQGIHTSSTSLLQTTNEEQYPFITDLDAELVNISLHDLDNLINATPEEVDSVIQKYAQHIRRLIKHLGETPHAHKILNKIFDIMNKAWAIPTHGHEVGSSLCNELRVCGGLDLLMENCMTTNNELQFATARLLEQCLTTENRAHVMASGLDKVVNVACICTNANSIEQSRVGTGILEHLFKHSEDTCSKVVTLGGLDALLFECRKSDVETLRHCASALANLSLYGGAENQEAMIKKKVPMWLFPLAFHNDDNIKYYACLAITVLVANAEIESQVLKSGTLGLVEPFVTSHNPSEFAKSNLAHAHGQSKTWLQHLVPVLSSKREEARNLAAFHFCMEAGIKKQQGNTNIFAEIGAVEQLKKVASCPNAVASKYAAKALRLVGEEVPHKLSQQVPLWSIEDVEEWVKQIGFGEYAQSFIDSRVDGDLLLQLTEENLKEDIGLTNGIKRIRFFRELQILKRLADYSSKDTANINSFLQTMGPEFSIYTYKMLNAGIETKESLMRLQEDQLLNECGITNSIHRQRIIESIRAMENGLSNSKDDDSKKSLDIFISYRRSNGSQLASLLKVHLQLRGFSVFIDVERLEAGKFDNNLLQSIQKAKHFLLVLTPNALDRCRGDEEKKDWVHKEICAALKAECNIIPIVDNFLFPETEELPEDMRPVCHFNAIKWIHDYQDACVDKLERFMRGEVNPKSETFTRIPGTPSNAMRQQPTYQRMHSNDSGSGKSSDKDIV
ncbi:NAD(+) hydrolase sarm1 isoform X3 [Atheta coriaria]|uniref:NAD(+) hydrolase sarm1 isoform X3 n=1 Tax=Dalotia coriaria TaxID=877792 RepID=UPI0031F3C794